jgi:hypothetical protein
LEILVFLKKAKNDGRRVQKIDYAKEKGVEQPQVNSLFNDLAVKELVAAEGYTSKQQEPKSSRPKVDTDAIMSQLDDLDIEESQKKILSEADNYEFKVGDKVRYNNRLASERPVMTVLRVSPNASSIPKDTIRIYTTDFAAYDESDLNSPWYLCKEPEFVDAWYAESELELV